MRENEMETDEIKEGFKVDVELYGMKDAVCNAIDKLMKEINK